MAIIFNKIVAKRLCPCFSPDHHENDICITADEILVDGLIKKVVKEQNQLEVAIGDGMEFTIHGDIKAKSKKAKHLLNNSKVSFVYL